MTYREDGFLLSLILFYVFEYYYYYFIIGLFYFSLWHKSPHFFLEWHKRPHFLYTILMFPSCVFINISGRNKTI